MPTPRTNAGEIARTLDRKPFWLPAPMLDLLSDPRRSLLLVALIACVIRFGSLLWLGPLFPMKDEPSYITPGVRLAEGLGYTRTDGLPALKRSPGFPMQIALSKWLTGGLDLALLLNAAWGVLAVLTVYALGKRAFGGVTVGAVAAILYAALPQPIYWQRLLLSESLHTMLILLWVLGTLTALSKGGGWRFVVVGLELAAVLYVRPASVLLLPAAPVLALLSRHTRRGAGWLLLSSLIAALAILPWAIRNYRVSGRIIPLATGFGIAAYEGNLGDGGNGGFSADYPGAPMTEDVIRNFQEAEARSDWDAEGYALSLVPGLLRDRLENDPWSWLLRAKLANLSRFFFGKPFAVPSPWWSDLQSAVVLAGLLLTSLSFPVVARRMEPRGPLMFCWILACLLCIHIATTSVRRYAEPILPFLALGSAAAFLGYAPDWWNRWVLSRPSADRHASGAAVFQSGSKTGG